MKNILNKIAYLTLLSTIFWLSACKKEEPTLDTTLQQNIANSDNVVVGKFDEVQDLGKNLMENTSVQGRMVSNQKTPGVYPNIVPCAVVTVEGAVTTPNGTGTVTRTITIDFGNTGTCTSTDGHKRKGKVIINFNIPANTALATGYNPYNVPQSTVTTTFDNHFVDNIKVEGTHTVTCISFSINGNAPNFVINQKQNVVVTGGKLTFPNNATHLWTCNRYKEFILNWNQMTGVVPAGSQGKVWGVNNGINTENVQYSGNILESEGIVWKVECFVPATATNPAPEQFPVQGKMTLNIANQINAVLDFGSGICDRIYTITINGQTYTITAP